MERKFTDVCAKQSYGTLRTMQSEYRKVFYARQCFLMYVMESHQIILPNKSIGSAFKNLFPVLSACCKLF